MRATLRAVRGLARRLGLLVCPRVVPAAVDSMREVVLAALLRMVLEVARRVLPRLVLDLEPHAARRAITSRNMRVWGRRLLAGQRGGGLLKG
jgi:hypothetical protein